MSGLQSEIIEFIEKNIDKSQYVKQNIEVISDTSDDYFDFDLRSDKESYMIYGKQKASNKIMPKNVVIPSKHDSKPVKVIANHAFADNEQRKVNNQIIETVTIPETIIEIGNNAFDGCKMLKKVIIKGERVPNIGGDVFKNTSTELSIYVPGKMVNEYKRMWSQYSDKIVEDTENIPYEQSPNQDGIVSVVVPTIVDSKDVAINLNFYFMNINKSDVNTDTANE